MIISGSHTNTNTAHKVAVHCLRQNRIIRCKKTFALEADFAPDQVRRFLEGNLLFKSDLFDQ